MSHALTGVEYTSTIPSFHVSKCKYQYNLNWITLHSQIAFTAWNDIDRTGTELISTNTNKHIYEELYVLI